MRLFLDACFVGLDLVGGGHDDGEGHLVGESQLPSDEGGLVELVTVFLYLLEGVGIPVFHVVHGDREGAVLAADDRVMLAFDADGDPRQDLAFFVGTTEGFHIALLVLGHGYVLQ